VLVRRRPRVALRVKRKNRCLASDPYSEDGEGSGGGRAFRPQFAERIGQHRSDSTTRWREWTVDEPDADSHVHRSSRLRANRPSADGIRLPSSRRSRVVAAPSLASAAPSPKHSPTGCGNLARRRSRASEGERITVRAPPGRSGRSRRRRARWCYPLGGRNPLAGLFVTTTRGAIRLRDGALRTLRGRGSRVEKAAPAPGRAAQRTPPPRRSVAGAKSETADGVKSDQRHRSTKESNEGQPRTRDREGAARACRAATSSLTIASVKKRTPHREGAPSPALTVETTFRPNSSFVACRAAGHNRLRCRSTPKRRAATTGKTVREHSTRGVGS
jgi:hypothetical protein